MKSTRRCSKKFQLRMLYLETIKLFILTIVCGVVMSQSDRDGYHGNPDDFVYPGPIQPQNRQSRGGSKGSTIKDSNESLQKYLQLMKRINSIESEDEFYDYIDGLPPQTILTSRIGGMEKSNAIPAKPAKCMPELQPVSLNDEANGDPSIIYYPTCTRIKRCGGCCGHSLLSCQPKQTEIRNYEVIVTTIDKNMRVIYKGKTIIPLEEHLSCKCDCRIKEEHCTSNQIYKEDECRCICNNVDDEEKCKRQNDTKLWDPETCACTCRVTQECSTGYFFDQNTCRCQQVPFSRNWFGSSKRTNYRFGQTQKPETDQPVIVTLDAADPRRRQKDDPEE